MTDTGQDMFEAGYSACWAEMFVQSGEKPPFALSDDVFDKAWDIYLATHPASADTGQAVRDAAIEAVAELQLAAFFAGRGSITQKGDGHKSIKKPAPTMDDFRAMALAALPITKGEGQSDA